MEATNNQNINAETVCQEVQQPQKRISKTAQWARAHKWCIEVIDPELQAQCKSYKDGQKIVRQ